MLNPDQTLDTYYLEARRDLLEVAALLDRYDEATQRTGAPAENEALLHTIRQAMGHLADPESPAGNHTKALLELFAEN